MDIEESAKVLTQALEQQYKDNLAANEANRRLADEQISYTNEARGTYYSGIPTWQRAQNAIQYADKANEINKSYASSQNSLWNTVSDYLDKINSYNEASGLSSIQMPSIANPTTSAPFLLNGVYYKYDSNGKLVRA